MTHAETHKAFDASVYKAIGPAASENDFPVKDLTPDYEAYDDNILTFDPDHGGIELMPETGDTFIGAEILLTRGGTMTKRCVTAQKQDVDGNLNSLTAMDAHERPLFIELLWCVVTCRIFIRSKS